MVTSILRSVALVSLGVSMAVSAAADRPRLVDERKISREWVPVGSGTLAAATYPSKAADPSVDACVNLGFQIDAGGKTSNFSLLKTWWSKTPDKAPRPKEVEAFEQQAALAVSTWRFERTPDAGPNKMVYTSANIAFVGNRGTPVDSVLAGCVIPDLNAHIAKLQDKSSRRGNLGKEKIDRHDRQDDAIERSMEEAIRNSSGR